MAAWSGPGIRGELSRRPGPLQRTGKALAAAVAWVVLLCFVLIAGFFVGGGVLSLVMLHTVPTGTLLAVAGVAVALVGLLSWLVARYVVSGRSVVQVLSVAVVTMLVGGTVWALVDRDDSLYLARTAAWGDSDVWDYQRFPAQRVDNAAPVYHYAKQPAPDLFRTIEYEVDGQVKEAPFDEFMRSSDTTAFIVIKDDAILYERYFNGWKRDSWFRSFSTAKSFTSAMVGIAIGEGYIGSVDDRLVKYVPELKGRGYDAITIRDQPK